MEGLLSTGPTPSSFYTTWLAFIQLELYNNLNRQGLLHLLRNFKSEIGLSVVKISSFNDVAMKTLV